jgi:hypothetical protein
MPQLKSQVAARPCGFTVAFSATPADVSPLGLPSVRSGGGIAATASAPAAFRRRPLANDVVRPDLRSAPFRIAATTAATERVGYAAKTSAATPATCGEAIDVPL